MKTGVRRFLVPAVTWSTSAALLLFAPGCGGSSDGGDPAPTRVYQYDFRAASPNGWEAGFADLPEDANETYELGSDPEAFLPPNDLPGGQKAFLIEGHNRSDDLFMFLKRRVDGLEPGRRYQVRYEVLIASNAPEDWAGIGGAPGQGVYLKAGASRTEPKAVSVPAASGRYIEMNVDKGNQSQGGPVAPVLGHIGIPGDEAVYKQKTLTTPDGRVTTVDADANGAAWLLVGTDSAFEGKTELYYLAIKATLTPVR